MSRGEGKREDGGAMGDDWRMQQRERADAALGGVVESTPGLCVDATWLIGTNYVAFGTYHNAPVVCKYFDWQPRKQQEEAALRMFAETGCVPKLYPVKSDSIVVMERLGGETLDAAERWMTPESRDGVYYQLGQAVARIVKARPGAGEDGSYNLTPGPGFDYAFYCRASVQAVWDTVIEQSLAALTDKEVREAGTLGECLKALADCREAVLAYPTFVQLDDFHAHNMMTDGTVLTGLIDLEMTRFGNEVLLLAAAANAAVQAGSMWAAVRAGYEDERGRELGKELLGLCRACAPYSAWIRFMWYWSTDDLPPWVWEEDLRSAAIRDIMAAVGAAEMIG